ncbi:hypothetical protein [Haladaptatus sp. W1]|uniref:hypothetical protein n=1 Tax=Haladaptatus sp. W1 TaxID=1897478 RepID=UPI000B0E58E3|nr:hypothetical protein [Haladaptatus sp. W1]
MAFPNLPGKQAADPLVTPAQHSEYRHAKSETGRTRLPEAVVLCYSRGLMDYLTETHDGQHVGTTTATSIPLRTPTTPSAFSATSG